MGSTPATRRAWHAVAELVLAGPQYRVTGTIRLRVTPGGFATTTVPDLRVDGVHLIIGEVRVPLHGATPAALAASAGVTAGAPEDLYSDGSGAGVQDVLAVDPAGAAELADAFGRGDAALRALAPDRAPVLWPEHLDVAVAVDEVNYGVSGGDGYLDAPYAYVGPWSGRPEGGFWNAPFGAARPVAELPDLLAFFLEGRDRAAAG